MNVRAKLLILILLISALPLTISTQGQEIPMGWDLGIETETDTAPTFDLDLDGEVVLEFWIDNQNIQSLALHIEYEIPFDGSVNGPDSIEVSSQSNETFEFTVHGVNIETFAAGLSDRFTIDATVTANGVTPSIPPGADSKDAEGNLTIPMVVDLTVDLAEPSGPMNAGTTTSLAVTVSNAGNAADSVYKATLTDSCPLLEITGEEELESTAIEPNNNLTKYLNVSSSASHPTKNCVIEIAIQSKGDFDAGHSVTADSAEVTLRVVEDRGGSGDDDGNSQSNNDDSDEGDDVVSQNWTPVWPGAVIFALLWATFARRRL